MYHTCSPQGCQDAGYHRAAVRDLLVPASLGHHDLYLRPGTRQRSSVLRCTLAVYGQQLRQPSHLCLHER